MLNVLAFAPLSLIPSALAIFALMFAKALGTTARELVGWDEDEADSPRTVCPKGVPIPVYGKVAAGIPIEMISDIVDTEEITEDMARTGEFFGLQIHGDSMEPRMREGDVVIVRKQEDAENGQVVIVTVDGTDATCKKLQKLESGILLISTNSKYEPKFFSNEEIENIPVCIIGRVVELRAKF